MTNHLALELRSTEIGEAGTFEGHASWFGVVDAVGDTVAPGAFTKSLAERRPLLLWMHDPAEPVGVWEVVRETAQGLFVKGRLILETARGREAYALLKAKALDGLSIGFRTIRSARTKTGRLLQELRLEEISLVTIPALTSARVVSVKSNAGQRSSVKDFPMSDDTYEIGTAEVAAELPPEVLERIEAVETKAGAVDELAGRLDRIETRLNRPGARVEVRDDPQAETKVFASWCRKGWDGLGDIEKKVLIAGTGGSPDPSGWQTIPETFLRELIRNLVLFSPMRSVARVQTVSGGPVLIPKRTSTMTAAWVAETVEHSVGEPAYTQMSVGIFEARVTTEVTNQLLEDSAFDIGAELARDFGEEFARLEGLAFVRGNGTSEPGGWWSASDFPTTTGGTLDADDLIDLYHAVPSVYAANGTWLMNRANMGNARKLKATGTGNYLWTESLQPGDPPSLLGRPVVEIPDLTTVGSPAAETVVAFGDWSSAFRIFDRVNLEILRDPYTLARRSIVAFHARKRVGSALVNPEAVRGLTIAG